MDNETEPKAGMIRILLIGHGAIGSHVFKTLQASDYARVVGILCRTGREDRARASLAGSVPCIDRHSLPSIEFDLVVECAGHAALAEHIPTLLHSGKDVISVSNGALALDSLAEELEQAAASGGAQLQLLSGAIGGLDALSAAAVGGLDSVVYRGRKPADGWRGSAAEEIVDLDALTEAVTHFTGTARDAARRFPKNANVAASVALAGIGLDKTRVELIADPYIQSNRHEIEATGVFGRFKFTIEGNALPGNPRSSALTAMSIVRAIELRQSHIRIG